MSGDSLCDSEPGLPIFVTIGARDQDFKRDQVANQGGSGIRDGQLG